MKTIAILLISTNMALGPSSSVLGVDHYESMSDCRAAREAILKESSKWWYRLEEDDVVCIPTSVKDINDVPTGN